MMKQNTEQRYLNFNKFLAQRATQISKFTTLLQSETSKRSFQSLPKTVRRRAMSHNRYRIPFRMRKPKQQQLVKLQSMQKIPKCRKHIRKNHRLMVSYRTRSGRIKWLNSHLWAAKRMRMVEYSGYKIAQSPNNKSFRSSYRNFRHNACLMDYSYLQCLTIRMVDLEKQESKLPKCIRLKHCLKINQYDRFYQGYLLDKQTNSQLNHNIEKFEFICPIMIFPQSSSTIRCLFDPFCLQEINKIQWNKYSQISQVQITKNKSEVYLLIGPEALNRVKEGLSRIGMRFDGKENEMFQTSFSLITFNQLNYLDGGSEQRERKSMISEPIVEIVVQVYDPNANNKIREQFFEHLKLHNKYKQKQIYQQYIGNKIKWKTQENQKNEQRRKKNEKWFNRSKKFWMFYEQLAQKMKIQGQKCTQYMIKVTNRSKYTHKRKNKLSKQEKKKIIMQEMEINKKQKKHIIESEQKLNENKMEIEQPIEKIQKIQQQKQQILFHTCKYIIDPIMIGTFADFHSKNSMYKGCFVFCSSRNQCQIWRALSQTNVKVIGRKQFRHCLFEAGLRFYPDDYPESLSFQKYNKGRAMTLINHHRRMPPQKRCSYKKIHSPFPFYFHVATNLSGLIPIKISMLSGGRCFTGSYICRLQSQDYTKLSTVLQSKGSIKSVANEQKHPAQQKSEFELQVEYNIKSYQQIIKESASIQNRMIRKIIGFITYGSFVESECREGGIGYLFEKQVQKDSGDNQGFCYVLVRKPTSRYYFVGILQRIQ